MCIIAVCDRLLTSEEFYNCEKNNPDGWGVAIYKRKGLINKIFGAQDAPIHVNKGNVTGVDGYNDYVQMLNEFKGCTHIIHFRYTSSGATCPELTHPFTLDMKELVDENLILDTSCSVLFHNGHFDQWQSLYLSLLANAPHDSVILDDNMSDTKAIAWAMTLLKDRHGINAVKKALAILDDKYVLLNPNGTINYFGYFFASKDNLVKFSNMTFNYNTRTQICSQ